MSILLILVTTIAFSDDSKSSLTKNNSDLSNDINNSIKTLKTNNDNLNNIEKDIQTQKKEIEETLKEYQILENKINQNINNLNKLSYSISDAKTDSEEAENQIENLQYKIDNNLYPSQKIRNYNNIYFITIIIVSNLFTVFILKYFEKK
jgi:chromosome segregation ATPase